MKLFWANAEGIGALLNNMKILCILPISDLYVMAFDSDSEKDC